jgi:uncharacterized C2H2 Zn-finger protein
MVNPCDVILTRGKNKGSTCGSINAKCKHVQEPMVCKICSMTFDRTTSYHRHVNTHKNKGVKIQIAIKKKEYTIKKTIPMSDTTLEQLERDRYNDVYYKILQLERQNIDLRKEVEVLKHMPVTTTNFIAVLGSDFYADLINKLGKPDAIKFLTQSCIKRSPLSVFQKLYLDDINPENYPVACKDELHFRYLDNEKKMVDDQGGIYLGDAVSRKISDAMMLAANENSGPSSHILQQEKLQSFDRDTMIQDLANITNNPNHPFFRDP